MSSAPKDEGGRARRRRRRGGGSAARNDADHSQQNRPARRQQQSQLQHQQQPQNSPQSSNALSRSTHHQPRNVRDSGRSQRQSGQGGDNSRQEAVDAHARTVEKQHAEREEQKRKEEEERKEREEHEAKERAERQAALTQQLARRGKERTLNLSYRPAKPSESPAKERPSDAELRQLDSSLKKCTGFLRKIRSSGLTEESVAALCQEAQALNLSRYISEVVAAISESKMRSADVEHVVTLCGELYRRYEDFTSQLVVALGNVIMSNAAGHARDIVTRKAAIRVLVELFVLGMVGDVSPVTSVLKQLVRGSKDTKEETLNNLGIVASFVRAGTCTLLPTLPDQDSPSSPTDGSLSPSGDWQNDVLPQPTRVTISSALQSYYDTEVTRLVKDTADELQKAGIAVTQSKNARGDPDDAATALYEASKQLYEKVCSYANTLADTLGKKPPASSVQVAHAVGTQVENASGTTASQILIANPLHFLGRNHQSLQETDFLNQGESPFAGEEERLFYTDLPSFSNQSLVEMDKNTSTVSASDADRDRGNDGTQREGAKPAAPSTNASVRSDSKPASGVTSNSDSRKRGSDKPVSLDKLLGRLSAVESKESVDIFVSQFVEVAESSKNAARRLAKSLFSVSAQKVNLLPAYSRIAACLEPVHCEVATTVAASLEEEFRYLAGRADMDEKNLAVCIKTSKFIGEFVKFGLISSSTLFDLLGVCVRDFSGHRVDIACHLLESCGRFLYQTPSTHIRMGNILETIWRLKSVKNLEARHNALVETAFFAAKPSSASKLQKRKCRSPIQEYVRHLIYYRLDATNIKWTQTQFLKLPWDEELEHYVIKKFVKISRARFSTIPYVSTLIALLQKYKPGLVVGIIDALLESIRSGLEKNDGRDSQRRIAEIQLLGELHKCGVVDERVIYGVLYQSITLGHDNSETILSRMKKLSASSEYSQDTDTINRPEGNTRSLNTTFTNAPDPPGDFFRIRIACVLMESCGRVLVASNRRKLEVFWVFFERYIFCKAFQAGLGDRLPLHISHVIEDAFEYVLQRERRLSKDGRMRRDNEVPGRARPARVQPRQFGSNRAFYRSESLADALEAVQRVESSASDTALIAVPIRHICSSQTPVNGTGSTRDYAPSGALRHELKPVTLRSEKGNDGGNSSSDDDSEEDRDPDGSESLIEELVHELNGNGSLVAGEGSFSGDDVDAEEDHSEVDDDEDEGDDDEEDDDEEDDDDDDSSLEVRLDRPKTEEEDAFAKELAAFTAAAVQSARVSSSRVTKFDRMAIPMSLMTKKMEEERAAAAAAHLHNEPDGDDSVSSGDDNDLSMERNMNRGTPIRSVEFKMLVRKGGKSQLQDLQVPASSSLALAAKENETADAARHEETKRLVLGSSIVLNHDEDDLDEDVPLRTQQSVRAKEESIRQQRSADEMELLSTLYRSRPKPRR